MSLQAATGSPSGASRLPDGSPSEPSTGAVHAQRSAASVPVSFPVAPSQQDLVHKPANFQGLNPSAAYPVDDDGRSFAVGERTSCSTAQRASSHLSSQHSHYRIPISDRPSPCRSGLSDMGIQESCAALDSCISAGSIPPDALGTAALDSAAGNGYQDCTSVWRIQTPSSNICSINAVPGVPAGAEAMQLPQAHRDTVLHQPPSAACFATPSHSVQQARPLLSSTALQAASCQLGQSPDLAVECRRSSVAAPTGLGLSLVSPGSSGAGIDTARTLVRTPSRLSSHQSSQGRDARSIRLLQSSLRIPELAQSSLRIPELAMAASTGLAALASVPRMGVGAGTVASAVSSAAQRIAVIRGSAIGAGGLEAAGSVELAAFDGPGVSLQWIFFFT